ncbi:MAG: serine/threonine-protein kinase [Pirellulales bacterium]
MAFARTFKPATYIIDVSGRVRYAYVGESLADRPSVSAIVSELKKLTRSMRLQPHEIIEFAFQKKLVSADQRDAISLFALGSDPTSFWEQIAQAGLVDRKKLAAIRFLAENEQSIPGYVLTGFIGSGGMGSVFEAKHLKLDRPVAIKTLRADGQISAKAIQRFYQEARTLARLQHSNIVTVYDFGEVQGYLYLTMELIQGTDLDNVVTRQGAQNETRVWNWMKQAALGLVHANEKGIVHRDLKPANLLLGRSSSTTENDLLKIVDFGLALAEQAEVSDRLTETGTIVGSPRYMAPEQLTGGEVGHACDVYGLGATAFHLLTGRPPYAEKSMSEIIAQKLTAPAPIASDCCPNVTSVSCKLVAKLMSLDPRQRPQGTALVSEIENVLKLLETDNPDNVETVEVRLSKSTQSETVTVTEPGHPRDKALLKKTLLGLSVVAAIVCAGFLSRDFFLRRDVTSVPMVEVGSEQPLFNGTSLSGWNRRSGNWIAEPNEFVIEGTNGVLGRPINIDSSDGSKKHEFFRFTVVVHRQDAAQVELHFGISAKAQREPRNVIRISAEGIELGTADSDQEAAFIPNKTMKTVIDFDSPFAVQLERQPGGWFISINEYPLTAIPLATGAEISEIRFAARRGKSWFSDVSLVRLAVKDSSAR